MSLVDLGKRLLESAKLGETEEVRSLMTSGAPFTTDWLGTSPLHLAAQYGHASTAEVLIRAGISRDARTKVDRTALHVAAQEGHSAIVDLLIRNGADIEAKDMLKMTPLHWAVERGHVNVIELLLQHGADVNSFSKFEKSPISIALDNCRIDIVQILQSSERYKDSNVEVTIESNLSDTNKVNNSKETVMLADESHPEIFIADSATKAVPVRPILLHASLSSLSKGLNKNEDSTEETTEQQSSTSVLATLAALAETMGPLQSGNNASAVEALQWLESHGLTVLPQENSTIITSALESGHTIKLTEAGKLALNFPKKKANLSGKTNEVFLEKSIDSVRNMNNQKVITIVADQSQLVSSTPLVVAMSDAEQDSTLALESEDSSEPTSKRMRNSDPVDDLAQLDRDQLARRLEEMQRRAKEFEEQLRMKENEAEEYKKKLESMELQNNNNNSSSSSK